MRAAEARSVARLARRNARREWRRSTLIAGLVALPVLVAVVVAGIMRANEVTPAERATGELGAADLRLELWADGPEELAEARGDVEELLPATHVHFREGWWTAVDLEGVWNARVTDQPLDHPLTRGRLRLLEGRPPGSEGEVAVSTHALEVTGHELGDDVELGDAGAVEIVGAVLDPLAARQSLFVLTPADLDDLGPGDAAGRGSWSPVWLADVEDPERAVSELESRWAELRGEVVDPAQADAGPAESSVTQLDTATRARLEASFEAQVMTGFGPGLTPQVVATLLAAVLLAEVALIAGAAYATGARRRLRELGLLGANGATVGHVRGAVLGEAAVTGILGGVVGVVGGVAALHFGRPLVQRFVGPLVTGVDLSATDVVGPVLAAVAAVVLAAWLPARTAAHVPTTTALQGRMPLPEPRRWIVPVGLLLAALGAVLFLVGALASGRLGGAVAGLGVLLAVGGTAMLTVPFIALVGRVAHRVPATTRLVMRDSARQRTRAAAASASAMVVLMVPLLVASASLSTETAQRVDGLPTPPDHVWMAPSAQRTAPQAGPTVSGPAVQAGPDARERRPRSEAVTAVADRLGASTRVEIELLEATAELPPAAGFRSHDEVAGQSTSFTHDAAVSGTVEVAGATVPTALASEGLADVLGGAVGTALADGHPVVLGLERRETTIVVDGRDLDARELPVPVLRHGFPRVLLPPDTVDELGLGSAGRGDLFVAAAPVDQGTRQALYQLASDAPITVGWSSGPSGTVLRWGATGAALLVALLILALVTMLSATESDRDLRTMVAVGAPPRLRRRFLGLQTGLHALVGALLGTPLAFALAWAALSVDGRMRVGPFGAVSTSRLWIDWPVTAGVVLGVPLVIAGAVALLVRSAPNAPPRRPGA